MDGGSGRRGRRPLRKAQSTPQASRRAAKRSRPRGRGMGGNRRKDHPKRGTAPRLPGQRLAKRKARKEQLVKFDFCPMTSECSTAQKVRKSQQSPARAHADVTLTEQNGLAPRPAARQGASRARNCAAISVFSFDGSTAVFFLGLTKKKMGVESCRASPAPPVGRPVYGTPYLGHGLRRPNFVPKFGASVIGIGPYGWLQRAATTTRAAL